MYSEEKSASCTMHKPFVMYSEEKSASCTSHTPTPNPEDPEAKLSIYQRHFQRPIRDCDPEEHYKPQNRRFSFLARGFLISVAVGCLVIIAILCAVLASVLDSASARNARKHPSPIRLALLENFPDPSLTFYNGTWYALGTNSASGILGQTSQDKLPAEYGASNVQLATSTDLAKWTLMDAKYDPLPEVGNWSRQGVTDIGPQVLKGNVWAPAVLQRPWDGKFVLYYASSVSNVTRAHCIGAAVTNFSTPAGPYEALPNTIACPTDEGGAIDPASFVDTDGTIYLAWKVDGNNRGNGGSCGNMVPPMKDTPIILQKMMADGYTPDGPQTTILSREADDGPLIEAPQIVRSSQGIYFLFFSSGCTRQSSYNLKYAYATNVTGPYTRADTPLLQSGDWNLVAPGSPGIGMTKTGSLEMAFHARVNTKYGGVRAMFTSRIELVNNTVQMLPPVRR